MRRDQVDDPLFVRPDRAALLGARRGAGEFTGRLAQDRQILHRNDDIEFDRLVRGRLHDGDRRDAHEDVATSSTGRTVADRPTRWAGRSSSSSSRSRDSARWAPRLVPATACTSSTMTVSTPPTRYSRACDVRIRNSDSGVVISTSGGCRPNRRRSSAGVSRTGSPRRCRLRQPEACAGLTDAGQRRARLRSTSTARAFSGET